MFIYVLSWPRYWDWYFPCVAYGIILNAICYRIFYSKEKQVLISFSPVLISSSIFLFLTGYSIYTYVVAITVAILSKFIFRVGKRHVFNPSCFAIIFLSAYGEGVRVSPHTPGISPLWLVFMIIGGLITAMVNRRVLGALSYVAGFLFFCFLSYLGGLKYSPIYAFSLLSYLGCLFTFHVLTDPQTSPARPTELIYYGLLVGFLDTILRALQITESNLVALALVSGAFALWRDRRELSLFFRERKMALLPRAIPIMAILLIVFGGMRFGYYPNPAEDIFHSGAFASTQSNSTTLPPVRYEEVGEKIKFGCAADFTDSNARISMHMPDGEAPFPGLAVADYDGDGFADVMISGREFCLLRNDHGGRFVDVTEESGLSGQQIVMAAFFDREGRGHQDIFAVTLYGEFRVFANVDNRYVDITSKMRLPKYNLGEVRSISFLDYDRDGYVDVLVSNFPGHKIEDSWRFVDLTFELPKKNFLFKNHGGDFFTDESEAMGLASKEYTHVIGISDMNGDGYPDLFIANDFAKNRLLYNVEGRFFKDVTKQAMGNIESRNSMSAEFGDVQGSGRLDLYATNVSLARFRHGMNSLWSNDGSGKFVDRADDYKIGRCGFAWGAKFLDAGLDGHLDLFVASGMLQGKTHIWYPYGIWTELPVWVRALPSLRAIFPTDFDLGGHERNCFFWNREGAFVDVADRIGLGGEINGHTVALIDLDNSGRLVILLGGIDTQLRAYQPIISGNPHWLGLELVGAKHNRDAIGARVSLVARRGYLKELYSGNSPSSQSDGRIIFGLGAEAAPVALDVLWPSGLRQVFSGLVPNAYYRLTEGEPTAASTAQLDSSRDGGI